MSEKSYDFVIIGSGPAGQQIALAAAEAGKTVAITEGYDYGGACPLRGCDPKMVLHGVADAVARTHQLCGKGIVEEPRISWTDLMAWKRTFTEPIPEKAEKKLGERGVHTFHGWATFLDAHRVRFGEETIVRGETIVIAAGMEPARLDVPGGELTLDSEAFLDQDRLPEKIIIIGGGYIGTGFANLACLLGAKVEVVVADPYPAAQFDGDLAKKLQAANEERGIVFHVNHQATAVRKSDDRLFVTIEGEDGKTKEITADRVFNCTGRTPLLQQLNLEAAGVDYDEKKGITVSSKLCTCVSHIYAVGDCTDTGLPLTPVATHEAAIIIDNLFHDKDRQIDYYPIPTVCFSDPPIAAVGMTQEEADKSPKNIRTKFEDATDWFHAHRLNSPVYAYKIFLDEDSDLVLGAHLVGPTAHELINLFALAIHQKITVSALQRMIWTYPTAASNLGKMLG